MTSLAESVRRTRPTPLRRRLRSARNAGMTVESAVTALLGVLTLAVTVLVVLWPAVVPFSALAIPLLLASLGLSPRTLPWFVVFVLLALMVCLVAQDPMTGRSAGAAAILFVMAFIVLIASFRRTRLGVAGLRGEAMFIDLRDRILNQGGIPELPAQWYAESALHSAGGTPFAGDFLVATRPRPDRLEVVVVDVSGKGEQAGTRALLLSGAFGGLLGALPAERFLPAANDYLLQQDWDEGFATAIHLSVDLGSGFFEIRSAGHPPAAHRAAGSGRWQVLASEGPVLGLIEGADFRCARGVIGHGDAVLLYTDGMVEQPTRDIEMGIDRMLGKAESLLRGDFVGSARRLVDALGSQDDDRAMLVVSRL